MYFLFSLLTSLLLLTHTYQARADSMTSEVSISDFAPVAGDGWKGTLTYLDYQPPHRKVALPASVAVVLNANQITMQVSYPDEPHANSNTSFAIADDGRFINGETVIDRTPISPNGTAIKTQYECEDNGAPARCISDYLLSSNVLQLTKTVIIEGRPPFVRNKYVFAR